MADPSNVASATDPMEILELIETWIGVSCELYAVDHADADITWIRIPDRDHTVSVARLEGPPDPVLLELIAEFPLGVDATHVYGSQPDPSLGDGDGVVLFSDGSGKATGPQR